MQCMLLTLTKQRSHKIALPGSKLKVVLKVNCFWLWPFYSNGQRLAGERLQKALFV